MTEDEARDQLRRLVASDTVPTLDGFELSDLLKQGRRPDRWGILDVDIPLPPGYTYPDGSLPTVARGAADGQYPVWAPGTVYALGDQIVPRRRNGHVYTCTQAGTSGQEDPALDTNGGVAADDSVIWLDQVGATVWQPTYDLNSAAALGWRWKAGKTTDRITFGSQGDNYNAEQLHTHCMSMAAYYDARSGPRTIKTPSARLKPLDTTRLPRAN